MAWVIAAADDYEDDFKHLAAVTTGVLALACLAALIGSLALMTWRWLRSRR